MQYSVTHKNSKIDLKRVIIAVLLIVIFILSFFLLVVSKNNNLIFAQNKFYLVCSARYNSLNQAISNQNVIKNTGGAGTIVDINNKYYLSVCVYHDKSDAEDVLKTLKTTYTESEIVEINISPVSRKNKRIIKGDKNLFLLFKYLKQYLTTFEKDCFDFAMGDLSEGKFLSKIINAKLTLTDLLTNSENKSEMISGIMNSFGALFKENIENIINNFYATQNKESLCYDSLVGLVLIFKDLCENL